MKMFYFVENDNPNLSGECFFGGEYIFIKYSGEYSFEQIKADSEAYHLILGCLRLLMIWWITLNI